MRDNESLEKYFLNMQQLCSLGNIEDAILIQYVINGMILQLKNFFFMDVWIQTKVKSL